MFVPSDRRADETKSPALEILDNPSILRTWVLMGEWVEMAITDSLTRNDWFQNSVFEPASILLSRMISPCSRDTRPEGDRIHFGHGSIQERAEEPSPLCQSGGMHNESRPPQQIVSVPFRVRDYSQRARSLLHSIRKRSAKPLNLSGKVCAEHGQTTL